MFTAIHRRAPLCQVCLKRTARACMRGEWRVMKDHDVCRQCWRTLVARRTGRG
ncbi:MAG TPA: hypothetical protein VGL81_37310 [Polyangiaceae bacterium]|jgi:hypothetical protein